MGLLINQNEPRSQVQSKIAADLSDRLNKRAVEPGKAVSQPAILDNQRQTSPLAWLWVILGVLAIAGIAYVLLRPSGN